MEGSASEIGYDDEPALTTGDAKQQIKQDVRFYLVPNPKRKDHWLIDGAAYSYEYGSSKQSRLEMPAPNSGPIPVPYIPAPMPMPARGGR